MILQDALKALGRDHRTLGEALESVAARRNQFDEAVAEIPIDASDRERAELLAQAIQRLDVPVDATDDEVREVDRFWDHALFDLCRWLEELTGEDRDVWREAAWRAGSGLGLRGADFQTRPPPRELLHLWAKISEIPEDVQRVLIHRLHVLRPAVAVIAGMPEMPETEKPDGSGPVEPPSLPELRPCDRQAYQLHVIAGMTQQKTADALNEEHGTTYKQGQISRMVRKVRAHAEASGLSLPARSGPSSHVVPVDPARLELGPRSDRRSAHQRERPDPDGD